MKNRFRKPVMNITFFSEFRVVTPRVLNDNLKLSQIARAF